MMTEDIPKFHHLSMNALFILSKILREQPNGNFKRSIVKGVKYGYIQKTFRELVKKGILEEDRSRVPFAYTFKIKPDTLRDEFHKQLDDLFPISPQRR